MTAATDQVSTREKILSVALELFVERGYDSTSLREIAEQLGFTKAALYYHFESKDEILRELVTRMLDQLESALDRVEPGMTDSARRKVVIEGWIDLLLDQRKEMRMMMQAHPHLHSNPLLLDVHERFHDTMQKMTTGLVGTKPGLMDSVRATFAVGGLLDVVAQAHHDEPKHKLRAAMLEVASAVLNLKK